MKTVTRLRREGEVLVPRDRPLSLLSPDFMDNQYACYDYLRRHLPVHPARIAFLKMMVVARYVDCMALVKDPRFGRNRARITGGGRFPFPLPGGVAALTHSMILEDDPEHRRLRNLVQKAFAPKNLQTIETRVTALAHELMDGALRKGGIDLQREYALPIPVRVISEMMGVEQRETDHFQKSLRVLSEGLSGWGVVRTFAWDLRKVVRFVRALIERKRRQPGDDILSALIHAEEEGDRLSEDELISMVFLLVIAGYETTVHLITNGVYTLLRHPDELARLRADPRLAGSAVEEILRFDSPVQMTKMNYAREDLELCGVRIPRGTAVVPLLGSANHDPDVFRDPEIFDIRRDPNRHLSFSQGNHFCLGAFLARMETRVALNVLLERTSDIAFAQPPERIRLQRVPGWHRYDGMPVRLAPA